MHASYRDVTLLIQSPQLLSEIRRRDDLDTAFDGQSVCVVHNLFESAAGGFGNFLAGLGTQDGGDGGMCVFWAGITKGLQYGIPGLPRSRSWVFWRSDQIRERGADPKEPL